MKEKIQNNYPFLSCISSKNQEYIGIIINYDTSIASIYDISVISDISLKSQFLNLGEIWWWESNRKIPINIFLKKEMSIFKYSIKTFNSKDVKLIFGPSINLREITEKRVKRKSVQLIKRSK